MTRITSKLFRVVGLSIAALIILGATHQSARADEVTIAGFTSGATSVPNLIFTPTANFTGTTALNTGSLSGPNSLGSFFLNPAPTDFLRGTFRLDITFTAPTGIAGGQGATYLATIFGSVSPNIDQGGADIRFDNPGQVFLFNDGTNSGSFSLTVANLFVQTGRSAQLTAGFVGSQGPAVPEPATLLLLGTGVAGTAAKLRSRRKAKSDAANT